MGADINSLSRDELSQEVLRLRFHVKAALDAAQNSLADDLQAGFKHSDLTIDEIAARYRAACESITVMLQSVLDES